DPEVLLRLAQVVPQVRLLGAGGTWEARDLAGRQGAHVRIVGWSFPRRWVSESPLAGSGLEEALARADGATNGRPVAVVGLLHADRDQVGSSYAPVSSAQLAAAPVDAWLLGHVHAPDAGAGRGSGRGYLGGYLGSLSSNGPGEAGARGAWLLEVAPSGALEL